MMQVQSAKRVQTGVNRH